MVHPSVCPYYMPVAAVNSFLRFAVTMSLGRHVGSTPTFVGKVFGLLRKYYVAVRKEKVIDTHSISDISGLVGPEKCGRQLTSCCG